MSEYFKDLLRLRTRFETETPFDPRELGEIDGGDKNNSIKKLNDDFYKESNPTYRPQSRMEVHPWLTQFNV